METQVPSAQIYLMSFNMVNSLMLTFVLSLFHLACGVPSGYVLYPWDTPLPPPPPQSYF